MQLSRNRIVRSPGRIGAIRGGISPYDADTQAFFDRLISYPSPTRRNQYRALISGFRKAGLVDKFDAAFMTAAADNGTAFISLIDGTFIGSLYYSTTELTFTADVGFSHGSNGGYILVGFNPATAVGTKFAVNDSMVTAYVSAMVSTNIILSQVNGNSFIQNIELFPKYSDNKTYYNMNGTEHSVTNNGSALGLWVLQRTAANLQSVYKDETLISSDSSAAQAFSNYPLAFVTTTVTCPFFGFGAALDANNRADLQDIVSEYMLGVGAIS